MEDDQTDDLQIAKAQLELDDLCAKLERNNQAMIDWLESQKPLTVTFTTRCGWWKHWF